MDWLSDNWPWLSLLLVPAFGWAVNRALRAAAEAVSGAFQSLVETAFLLGDAEWDAWLSQGLKLFHERIPDDIGADHPVIKTWSQMAADGFPAWLAFIGPQKKIAMALVAAAREIDRKARALSNETRP